MPTKKTLTPGAIGVETGTLHKTKEDVRLDSIIPSEILENKDKLDKFLQAYYTFMNMDEFIYQENLSFNDIVLGGLAQFRIADPNNDNNKFFTDETGANSTLVLTSPSGTIVNIPLTDINVAITNGNELPGSLATSTSEIGKTFTVNGLAAYNNYTAKLTTIVKYWVGPGPSYVMNTIEEAMDIDTNADNYLELMQKEIAATIPRAVTVNKRILYKQIIDFYRLRGSSDSIEIFFKILFNDFAEVEFPYDKVLIPSSGNWDVNPNLTKGGQYLDNKGFLSDSIVIQDSLKFQKFSYLIKTGKNLSDWELSYDRLVHPAGFIYFAEILIFLQLTKAVLGEDEFDTSEQNTRLWDNLIKIARKVLSAMPNRQPGIVGPEDIPLLVEMFASTFLPSADAFIHKTGTLSVSLKTGVINGFTNLVGGSGYTSVPTITTSDAGTPSGFTAAVLTASLTNGGVSSIAISNGGKDYQTPVVTIAAPSAITFDGSDEETPSNLAGIIHLVDNTIKLTSAQQAALPVNSIVTYNTTGTVIGGLSSAEGSNQYRIHTSNAGKIKLKPLATEANPEVEIDITSVGSGANHTFTGETATVTATTLDGALESISIAEPGFGYPASPLPTITFNGIELEGETGVAPSVTIGLDAKGRLDVDNITINSEGSGWKSLFATVQANANAGSIASIDFYGLADKNYLTAPTIIFPQPTAKDADGNLLSSNVLAAANFTIASADVLWTQAEEDLERLGDAAYQADPNTGTPPVPEGLRVPIIAGAVKTFKGEITGVNITQPGLGYISNPIVRLGSSANTELRVPELKHKSIINLNHNHVDTLITEVKTNPVQATGSQDGRTLYDNGRIRDNVIGIVTSVTVDAGGSGYSSATVTFSGGGATVPATGTVTLTGDAVSSISITSGGYGYTSAPTVTISGDGTSASATATVNLNWNITQSSSSADKFLPEHRVKVVNTNFRTIINNNYKQRKGTGNFYDTARLYNTNQSIEFLGDKTLQTIDSTDINNYNTSTFVHIE